MSNFKKSKMYAKALLILTAAGLLFVGFKTKFWENPNDIVLAQDSSVNWTQFQFDAQNSGRTSVAVDVAAPSGSNKVIWAWIDETHVAHDFVSRVVTDTSGNLITGTKITDEWNRPCESYPSYPSWPCNTNYPAGKIEQSDVVFAEQMQPIVADGKVFFGAVNGVMYAVDALDGEMSNGKGWKFQSGGAILAAAAYHQGTLIFGSMDGKIYGLNAGNGSVKWSYTTGAGINAAPILYNGTILAGSRDGYFYALNASNGNLLWKYKTKTTVDDQTFEGAPIMSSAAVSADGNTVMFGAENMYFYALSMSNGAEIWKKKLIGQSFMYSWPVVSGDKVIVRTMSSLKGAEKGSTGLENPGTSDGVLDQLSADPDWQTEEKPALIKWLADDPHQKTMYVLNTVNGRETYEVAMGRVTGNNNPPHPPAVDNEGRLLTYWRVKKASYTNNGQASCFGTIYCPDVGAMDMNTGDRIKLTPLTGFNPELDNAFAMSVGGNYLYLHNHFRGLRAINLTTNKYRVVTSPVAKWDWGEWRYANIVYYGNDEFPAETKVDPKLPKTVKPPAGFVPVVPARVNGRNLLFVPESRAGVIAVIEHQ